MLPIKAPRKKTVTDPTAKKTSNKVTDSEKRKVSNDNNWYDKAKSTEYGAIIKYTNGNETRYIDKHTGEHYTKSQAKKVEDEWNRSDKKKVANIVTDPVLKGDKPSQIKKKVTNKTNGIDMQSSRKVTSLSQIPKSAKLEVDGNEATWLTNDGHLATAELNPKTKKIMYVSVEG